MGCCQPTFRLVDVRRQMRERLHLPFAVGLLTFVLNGCGDNPDDIARGDDASLDQLHNQGASVESMRELLTARSYGCTDVSGSYSVPDGLTFSAHKYIYCTKTLPDGRFCTRRLQVFLVPDARGRSGIYFARGPVCLWSG